MIKKVKDPGVGYQSSKNAQRIINEDGSSNVIHVNRKKGLDDLYAHLIEISWFRFFFFVILVYIVINILFAVLYNFIGIEQITPSTGNIWRDLLNGFFFSAQTITTVGYGGIAPQGLIANMIASFQAMIGLLGFSFITGLLYGRFSKPKTAVKFSENIIVRDFKEHRALMFRLMNSRKSIMIEPEVSVTLAIAELDNKTGNFKRNFYQLQLERDKIMYLPTMWTVVHKLDEKSPLIKYSNEELKELDAELYILMQYQDEAFSQKLYKIYSYKFDKLKTDVHFENSFSFNEEGYTLLNHDMLDKFKSMD